MLTLSILIDRKTRIHAQEGRKGNGRNINWKEYKQGELNKQVEVELETRGG